jgi:hypothetical protein
MGISKLASSQRINTKALDVISYDFLEEDKSANAV